MNSQINLSFEMQNSVLESVRNFLSNLEEEKRCHKQLHSLPPPSGPVAAKYALKLPTQNSPFFKRAKARKKDKRKSREWQGAASSKNSRSASPDSGGEEAEQVKNFTLTNISLKFPKLADLPCILLTWTRLLPRLLLQHCNIKCCNTTIP